MTRGAALGATAALLETLSDGKHSGGIPAKLVEGAVLGAASVMVGRMVRSPPPEPGISLHPHPDRPVLACVGDGAMQMNGINGLITIAKYWEQWSDPRLIILVLQNHDLNQVTWEQRIMADDPKFEGSQNVPPFDYAAYAQSLGLLGITMRTPDDIVPGWEQALAARRPVVVDAHTDPEVPPLPPHLTVEQAMQYTTSVLKGDPHAWRMIKQSAKQMADTYLPGGGSPEPR